MTFFAQRFLDPIQSSLLKERSNRFVFFLTFFAAVVAIDSQRAGAEIPWAVAKARLQKENVHRAKGFCFVLCTIYYTPMESGFVAARGFDVRLETRPGLKGRKYPHDFLLAVKKEGTGRTKRAVDGCSYIRYKDGGVFNYLKRPIGRNAVPLVARASAATRRDQEILNRGTKLIILDPRVQEIFRNDRWRIVDTGGALQRWQIDLYWGEEEPLGPGNLMTRPRGTNFEYAYSEARVQR